MSKKVLFLAANLLSGGAERQIVTVARLLKHHGHNVSFYCYGEGNFYGHLLEEDNIPIVWEYSFDKPLRRIIKARNFIRQGKFDAVVSFLPPENCLNGIAAIGCKKWKVITGLRFCPKRPPATIKEKVYAWLLRFSDTIVSNSYYAAETWSAFRPKHREKFKVIYNNVQLGSIGAEYVPKADGKLHIVVAASYQILKNAEGLIKALSMMSEEERKGIHIDWYGNHDSDETYYSYLVKKIKEERLESQIEFKSQIDTIYDMMNRADAVMLLSHTEGLPNAICEGMMLGKPIILTRVSDYKVLVDEKNGLLCDSNDIEGIKNALLKMASLNTSELLELGKKSKQKAENLFSEEIITNKWESLI